MIKKWGVTIKHLGVTMWKQTYRSKYVGANTTNCLWTKTRFPSSTPSHPGYQEPHFQPQTLRSQAFYSDYQEEQGR